MRGTGEFHTHIHRISCPIGTTAKLVFFGDVHKFAPGHCEKTWNEFVDRYRTAENTYFIGMGDYLDLLSASERGGFEAWAKHESTSATIEDWLSSLVDKFGESIAWMRGRLIGMLEGNHHYKFGDGSTTAMRLCRTLSTTYLGDCAIVRVVIEDLKQFSRSSTCFDIALHHGIGGGKLSGSMFNSLDHMMRVIEGCSIYAMGDNHQRGGVPIQRLAMSMNNRGNVRVQDREILLVRTGAFLRAYMDGKPSYVVDKLMSASNLGSIRVEVTPVRTRVDPEDGTPRDAIKCKMEVVA